MRSSSSCANHRTAPYRSDSAPRIHVRSRRLARMTSWHDREHVDAWIAELVRADVHDRLILSPSIGLLDTSNNARPSGEAARTWIVCSPEPSMWWTRSTPVAVATARGRQGRFDRCWCCTCVLDFLLR